MTDERQDPRYWFPAKKYGWGWSLPTRWQGWIALLAYVALVTVNAFAFPPATDPVRFFAGTGLLTAAFALVCYLKGEPPAWRWGKS